MVNAKDMQIATSFEDFNKKFLTHHFLILFKDYTQGAQTLTLFYRGCLPLPFYFYSYCSVANVFFKIVEKTMII
jgi:hypothetical protein